MSPGCYLVAAWLLVNVSIFETVDIRLKAFGDLAHGDQSMLPGLSSLRRTPGGCYLTLSYLDILVGLRDNRLVPSSAYSNPATLVAHSVLGKGLVRYLIHNLAAPVMIRVSEKLGRGLDRGYPAHLHPSFQIRRRRLPRIMPPRGLLVDTTMGTTGTCLKNGQGRRHA